MSDEAEICEGLLRIDSLEPVDCTNRAEWIVNNDARSCSGCIATFLHDDQPTVVRPIGMEEER